MIEVGPRKHKVKLWMSDKVYYSSEKDEVMEEWDETIEGKEIEVISHKMASSGNAGGCFTSILYKEFEGE